MLQNWEFSIDLYKSIFQWMDANPGSEASQAAIWFLNNNKVWESWVTPEAAAAVNAALAGES
jgi:ABC-type proline/glycine betaine transport system substrate-binding protein